MKIERIVTVLTDVMCDTARGEPLRSDTRHQVADLISDLLTIRNLQDDAQAGSKNKKAMVEAVDLLQSLAQPACAAVESLTRAIEAAGAQTKDGGG